MSFKIHVDEKGCKGCGICIEFCPKKVYVFSKKLNKQGVRNPDPVNEKECIGCRICEVMCPDMAIEVEEEP